jgi:hypothetical protein
MSGNMKILDTLRCYFFGISLKGKSDGETDGLCGFAIPDLGILYKDRIDGSLFECQYRGLLELLRFIDSNIKSLKELDFEIFTDAAVVVYQLNNVRAVSHGLRGLNEAALRYKSRLKYRISWIPHGENEALRGMLETPAMKPEIEIKFDDRDTGDEGNHDKGRIGI